MQPLNYLRSASEHLMNKWVPAIEKTYPKDAETCRQLVAAANSAQKFVIPRGGRIFNDRLRGLPEDLRLPYPCVVIEYESNPGGSGAVERVFTAAETIAAPKRIVVASEDAGWINVFAIIQVEQDGHSEWLMLPFIISAGRGVAAECPKDLPEEEMADDIACSVFATGSMAEALYGSGWKKHGYYDMIDELQAALELIEALSCSNVEHEALPVRKMNKGAMRRGALPFDEYRALVVRGAQGGGGSECGASSTHRSPREHLRRGHIRRLPDGRKIWVSSCVVNSGAGGVVFKTYEVRS